MMEARVWPEDSMQTSARCFVTAAKVSKPDLYAPMSTATFLSKLLVRSRVVDHLELVAQDQRSVPGQFHQSFVLGCSLKWRVVDSARRPHYHYHLSRSSTEQAVRPACGLQWIAWGVGTGKPVAKSCDCCSRQRESWAQPGRTSRL